MRMWRNPTLIVAAMLALFASFLPSQAWFCPMTGRASLVAQICPGMTQPCPPQSNCCKLITLAPDAKNRAAVFNSSQFVNGPQAELVAVSPIVAPLISAFEPRIVEALQRRDFSFYYSSRHGPPLFSGRAPPA